jgi:hypothetical protein
VDRTAFTTLVTNVTTQIDGVRARLAEFDRMRPSERAFLPVVGVTHSDASMRSLLQILATNATTLGIPITGTTDQERFRSLNNWLNAGWRSRSALTGRNQDSAIDNAAFTELVERLRRAFASPTGDMVAADVVPTLTAAPPTPAPQPAPPVAPPVAAPQPAATPSTAAQPAAPAVVPSTPRTENAQLLYDLQFIADSADLALSDSGTSRAQRTALTTARDRARRHLRDLNRQFDAASPNARAIASAVRDATAFREREIRNAETRAAERNRRSYELSVGSAPTMTLRLRNSAGQMVDMGLVDAMNELLGDATLTSALATASNGAMRVSSVWLLDESSIRQVVALLWDHHMAAGDRASAQPGLSEAVTIYNREQAFYAFLLDRYVIPVATASRDEVHGSSLPTGARTSAGDGSLQDMERRHGRDAGTYYNIPVRERTTGADGVVRDGRILDRVRTGREDLERVMQGRLDAATGLQRQRGNLSFWVVRDLRDAVTVDTNALHTLVGLWSYARSHGMDTYTNAQITRYATTGSFQQELWEEYSRLAAQIVDPRVDPLFINPVSTYSRELQERIIRAHLGVPEGTALTPAQIAQGRSQLGTQLRRNRELMYDYSFYGFFEHVRRLAPSSADVARVSQVRSLRGVVMFQYGYYIVGPGYTGRSPELPATTPRARIDEYRFNMIRGLLQNAIQTARDSGMPQNDAALAAAQALFDFTATRLDAAALNAMSDRLYRATMGLLSIREAELRSTTASLRPSSLERSAVSAAGGQITRARNEYVRAFSRPQLVPTFHSNDAFEMADEAVQILSPQVFMPTEASEMYLVRNGYSDPAGEGVRLANAAAPTDAERRAGALAAETAYQNFLIALRSDTTLFGPSAVDSTLGSLGLAGPARALGLDVGRARPDQDIRDQRPGVQPAQQIGGFPEYRPIPRRMRPTLSALDQHVVGETNYLNPNLATRPHEDLGHYQYGQVYRELYRMLFLHYDSATPALLRGFENTPATFGQAQLDGSIAALVNVRDAAVRQRMEEAERTRVAQLRTRVQGIMRDQVAPLARRYRVTTTDRPVLDVLRELMLATSVEYSRALTGTDTTALARVQQDFNTLALAVTNIREAQLQNLIGGYDGNRDGAIMVLADNTPMSVQELLRRTQDPRNPRQLYDPRIYYVIRAQEALTEARGMRSGFTATADLFRPGPDPREAIAILENGIESLSHCSEIPRPPPILGQFSAQARLSRADASSRDRVRAIADQVHVIPAPGQAPVPLADWERQNGRQSVNYMFFIYWNTGVTFPGTTTPIYLLLDPAHLLDGELRPVGMVYGDAVVRVRASTGIGARDMPWEIVRHESTQLPVVMFPLQSGSLTPVMGNADLNSMLPQVSAFANQDRNYVEMYNRDLVDTRGRYEVIVVPSGTPTQAAPAAAPAAPAQGGGAGQPPRAGGRGR